MFELINLLFCSSQLFHSLVDINQNHKKKKKKRKKNRLKITKSEALAAEQGLRKASIYDFRDRKRFSSKLFVILARKLFKFQQKNFFSE